MRSHLTLLLAAAALGCGERPADPAADVLDASIEADATLDASSPDALPSVDAAGDAAIDAAIDAAVDAGGAAMDGPLCDGIDDDGDGTLDEDCDALATLTDGATLPLVGSCSVTWYLSNGGSNGTCYYSIVSTYTGTAAPLDATLHLVSAAGTWTAQLRDIESVVTSPQPLGVSFPGPYVTWNADLDVTLASYGGRAYGNRTWKGPCMGVCSGPLPSQTSYSVSLTPNTRAVRFTVGGYLPTEPHPTGLCWTNQASLSCTFNGTY